MSAATKTVRPCGFVLTGKIREHLAHYRACPHPACRARIAEWDRLKKSYADQQRPNR